MHDAETDVESDGIHPGPRNAKGVFRRALREHRAYLWIVVVYAAAAWFAAHELAGPKCPELWTITQAIGHILFAFALIMLLGHAIYIALVRRPENPFQAIWEDLRDEYLDPDRLAAALIVLVSLPIFTAAFTMFKVLIPRVQPYVWDAAFAALDQWLHFGVHPWELLQPVLGTPPATFVVNTMYHLWKFVVLAVFFWQAYSQRDRVLRMRFLLSFVLIWIILGTVAATAFSSGGPVYYGRLVDGPDIYEPLMAYLHATNEVVPVLALNVQDILWDGFEAGSVALGGGISAMPSLHMATSFLLVLVGWRTNRVLGVLLTVFAAFILVGSVHLAWHYAIDSYAGILGAWLIWVLAGRWAARLARSPRTAAARKGGA